MVRPAWPLPPLLGLILVTGLLVTRLTTTSSTIMPTLAALLLDDTHGWLPRDQMGATRAVIETSIRR
jgi:hypothetical protein